MKAVVVVELQSDKDCMDPSLPLGISEVAECELLMAADQLESTDHAHL